ncbi:MAG: arylsulfatase, partial [Planctomycetota bacterium]
LKPAFEGKELEREMLFFEHEGNRAIRIGDWKLVAKGRAGQDDVQWELFNIAQDRSELRDLREQHPERFQSMKAAWLEKATQVQALPWPKNAKKKKQPAKNNQKKS